MKVLMIDDSDLALEFQQMLLERAAVERGKFKVAQALVAAERKNLGGAVDEKRPFCPH